MELRFLGTGGGRYVTGEQLRKTAGIVVDTEETRLHIDPGPGAIVYAHQELGNPLETDAVVVSHAHLDHANDAEAVIEMMTEAAEKPGVLFGNETVLRGYGDLEKKISDYHQDLCSRVDTLGEGDEYEFRDLTVRSQEMFHSDPRTAGFVVEGEREIGFWTDTEYSEELLPLYEDCDVLVVYCTRAKDKGISNHTSISDVPDIVEGTGVSTVIITHFGYDFLKSDLESQEEWLEEQVDAKVIFAEDGMRFPGNRKLSDF